MECIKNHIYSNEELIALVKTNTPNSAYYMEMLYYNNIALFNKLAYKYSTVSWCHSKDDMLQSCYLALVKAVKYYSKTETPFFNFLFRVCNQFLYNEVNNTSNKELAEKKKITYVSLYQAICEDGEGETQQIIDTIASEEAQNLIDAVPEALYIESLKQAEIQAIERLLSNREAEVIKLYYGIDSVEYNTVEIARLLNVNTSRVNECLHNAYRKLRRDKNLKKFWETEYAWR